MLLCLVTVGVPMIGQLDLKNLPHVHGDIKVPYGSLVDCPSNPEMFALNKGEDAYPAYIIHFK